jgi:hypothetical protein
MKKGNLVTIIDGFFENIPNKPGVYAWFYPLFVYEDDTLNSFFKRVEYVISYNGVKGEVNDINEICSVMKFANSTAFSKTEIIKKDFFRNLNDSYAQSWDLMKCDQQRWTEFKNQLLAASIFLRPLYIGKADNLLVRINQHLNDQRGANSFACRFEEHMKKMPVIYGENSKVMSGLDGSVNMSDLHLSYIEFNDELHTNTNKLLEKILQHFIQPNFSEK